MLRDYFSASYIIPFDPWMGDIRITAFLVLDTCNPILYRAGMLDLTASGLPASRSRSTLHRLRREAPVIYPETTTGFAPTGAL